MAGTNLSFSKVVATPTSTAWSQAYSAGSLFAAISLQNETPSDDNNLNTLGKDVISTLESEFFTLETKDLESIKKAIETTTAKINENITLSFVICFLNENILYLYASGSGKALLKRGEKIGTVIDSEDSREIKSASGYVQDNDYIILQTKPFNRMIPSSTIASALDKEKVEDISEELAPYVHEKEEGGASAIILSYKENSSGIQPPVEETSETESSNAGMAAAAVGVGASAAASATIPTDSPIEDTEQPEELKENSEEEKEDETNDEIEKMEQELNKSADESRPEEAKDEATTEAPIDTTDESSKQEVSETAAPTPFPDAGNTRRRRPRLGLGRLRRLPRRLIVLIGVILIILLIVVSAYFLFIRGGSNSDFDAIYSEANEKYEEGLSLLELNESLAEENFRAAQQILVENQNTFPEGSSEDDQIEALLAQVNQQLGEGGTGGGDTTTATEVDSSESKILALAIENDTNYLTQNEDFILFITDEGIVRVDKGNDEEETVIDADWTDAGGIGVFGSNIYVLDREDNILKFVPTEDTYSKTNYITGDVPDLTTSTSMAIDGSIYVLDESGTITKFTRGTEDNFSTSGLSTPLSSPSQIWTTEDLNNIYILDNGNSRIVVLGTDGEFQKAYTADIIKDATAFEVREEEGQIFVLSGNKIYKITL